MNRNQAIKVFREQDKKGNTIFSSHDLRKFFLEGSYKTFNEGLKRLVKSGIIQHACRNVYVNQDANQLDSFTIERIAKSLRRGEYNYLSLEFMLSEYGIISQIPIDRITIMTTGRKGTYHTSYGVIEFTHTKRTVTDILKSTYKVIERPLRMASPETALRDLKRVGRNMHLVSQDEQRC